MENCSFGFKIGSGLTRLNAWVAHVQQNWGKFLLDPASTHGIKRYFIHEMNVIGNDIDICIDLG